MKIERTGDEVIIRIPGDLPLEDVQQLVDYIRYRELTRKANANQEMVDVMTQEINKGWWGQNRDKLLG